jgi:antirestriction protein ArdC
MLREYTVFNVAQCEKLPSRITNPPVARPRHHDTRDPLIEEFIAITGAEIHEEGNSAAFIPSVDTILMPPFTTFDSADTFYGVLFHELAHWTGHKSRLDRDLPGRFGDQAHAAEELIAELAAAFLCAEFSIDGDPRRSSYVGRYIKLLEGDARAFLHVRVEGAGSSRLSARPRSA